MFLSPEAVATEVRWAEFVAPKGSLWENVNGLKLVVVNHAFDFIHNVALVVYEYGSYRGMVPVTAWTKDVYREI